MRRRAMGELEATVMEVLWERGGWLTPGQVREAFATDPPLAYTTIMTILVRLWRKDRVERRRDGRAYAYRASQTREEYAAARMAEMLGVAGDRPMALARFIESLTAADRTQLRNVLRRIRSGD